MSMLRPRKQRSPSPWSDDERENDPSLDEKLKRNRLQLKFNWENIFRKYENVKESGVEVDLTTFDVYAPEDMPRREIEKHARKCEALGSQFGLSALSAQCNDTAVLEGDERLIAKCKQLDSEFGRIARIAFPHAQRLKRRSAHRLKHCRPKIILRETIQEHEMVIEQDINMRPGALDMTGVSSSDESVIILEPGYDSDGAHSGLRSPTSEIVLPGKPPEFSGKSLFGERTGKNRAECCADSSSVKDSAPVTVTSRQISPELRQPQSVLPRWTPRTNFRLRKRSLKHAHDDNLSPDIVLPKKLRKDEVDEGDASLSAIMMSHSSLAVVPQPTPNQREAPDDRALSTTSELVHVSGRADSPENEPVPEDSIGWNEICDLSAYDAALVADGPINTFLAIPISEVRPLISESFSLLQLWVHFATSHTEEIKQGCSSTSEDYASKEERRYYSHAQQRNKQLMHGYKI